MDTCGSHTTAWHASLDNQIAGMPVYEANYPQLGGSRRRKRKFKKSKKIKSKQLKNKTKKRKSNKRSKKKSKRFRR